MTARDQLRKEARTEATLSGGLRRAIHASPMSLSMIAKQFAVIGREDNDRVVRHLQLAQQGDDPRQVIVDHHRAGQAGVSCGPANLVRNQVIELAMPPQPVTPAKKGAVDYRAHEVPQQQDALQPFRLEPPPIRHRPAAQRLPARAGAETMLGRVVPAVEPIDPAGGKVFIEGEYWNAVSTEAIAAGQAVEIVALNGLTLTVKPMGTSKEEQP